MVSTNQWVISEPSVVITGILPHFFSRLKIYDSLLNHMKKLSSDGDGKWGAPQPETQLVIRNYADAAAALVLTSQKDASF